MKEHMQKKYIYGRNIYIEKHKYIYKKIYIWKEYIYKKIYA